MVAFWNRQSARCAARTLGVDHKAAFTYYGRFRRARSDAWLRSGGDPGFRPGEVFEVDETQVRGVWAESVRGKKKVWNAWVWGALQRSDRRLVLLIIPDRKASTLLPLVTRFLPAESVVCTDGLSSYNALGDTHDHR